MSLWNLGFNKPSLELFYRCQSALYIKTGSVIHLRTIKVFTASLPYRMLLLHCKSSHNVLKRQPLHRRTTFVCVYSDKLRSIFQNPLRGICKKFDENFVIPLSNGYTGYEELSTLLVWLFFKRTEVAEMGLIKCTRELTHLRSLYAWCTVHNCSGQYSSCSADFHWKYAVRH